MHDLILEAIALKYILDKKKSCEEKGIPFEISEDDLFNTLKNNPNFVNEAIKEDIRRSLKILHENCLKANKPQPSGLT
jgi:hypothetical protein